MSIKRNYLKTGDRIYCTGAYLKVVGTEDLELDTAEDDMYHDGLLVNWDEDGGYYTEENDPPKA